MRVFKNFTEAIGEIKRDLAEMGVRVDNTHMQDKVGSFPTKELFNYGYTVLSPNWRDDVPIPNKGWFDAEWGDRVEGMQGQPKNPGRAMKYRRDIWDEFLENEGVPQADADELPYDYWPQMFSYTYPERFAMNLQVLRVIKELKKNPKSRQLYIGMWDPHVDSDRLGVRRVPCSLGWHLLYREDKLNITYTMRSCDFGTHWGYDVALACRLMEYVAESAGLEPGTFSQFINSFHVYEKDVSDVF